MQSGRMQSVELKYCERCGTLGLRRRGSSHIYCEGCAEEMANVYKAPSGGVMEGIPGRKPCVSGSETETFWAAGQSCDGRSL